MRAGARERGASSESGERAIRTDLVEWRQLVVVHLYPLLLGLQCLVSLRGGGALVIRIIVVRVAVAARRRRAAAAAHRRAIRGDVPLDVRRRAGGRPSGVGGGRLARVAAPVVRLEMGGGGAAGTTGGPIARGPAGAQTPRQACVRLRLWLRLRLRLRLP